MPSKTDGKPVLVMPPYFGRAYIERAIRDKVLKHLQLKTVTVYRILNSEKYNHIYFSKKEKGLCDLCYSLKETIRGLQTRICDESSGEQQNFLYVEENDSKGSHNVAGMVY